MRSLRVHLICHFQADSYWVHNRELLEKRNSHLFTAGGPPLPDSPWLPSSHGKILHVKGVIITSKVEQCAAAFRILQLSNDLSDYAANVGTFQSGFEAYQAYIVSCMELAAKCSQKYGQSGVGQACRRSLIGWMMPEAGGTTSTAVCVPATDSAIDSLFDDFEKLFSLPRELSEAMDARQRRIAASRLAQNNEEEQQDIRDDYMALMARFASALEKLKDYSKKNNLVQAMADACKGRRFFITDCERYMGVAPDITVPGDKICALPGCCAPFVIRPKGARYQLIGECYVAGTMDGEIMASEKDLLQDIFFE